MTHHETAKLGREAEQALEVVNGAFDLVRDGLVKKLLAATPGSEAVHSLHASAQAVDAARQAVIQVIANGKQSEHALKLEQKLA